MEEIIKTGKGTVVDVRTRGEYLSGHVKDSINIPLNEIQSRVEEIKDLAAPLVLCCASGNRSGQASYFLAAQGIECYNGGPWFEVNYLKQQYV